MRTLRWVGTGGVAAGLCLVMASGLPAAEAGKTADPKRRPQAVIETSKGKIVIELFQDLTPKTVDNFIKLANQGFYNGLIFHRVIPGFMVQTGDPEGTGMGGPSYTFDDEFVPSLRHDRAGIVSMANRGPDTNGSQFFIALAPTPWLDGKHTIFGQVVSGQEVVDLIAAEKRDQDDRPLNPPAMKRVTIQEPPLRR